MAGGRWSFWRGLILSEKRVLRGNEGGEDDPGYFGQLRSEESDGEFEFGVFGSTERCLRL